MQSASIISAITLLLFSASFQVSLAALTTGMPCTNASPATQAQVDASDGGIKLGQLVCPNDVRLGISNDAGQAKAYLNSMPNACVGGCQAPPDKAHIDKLNNTFAVCAASFFKAYAQRYGPVGLSSAYRDGPSGENARAGGVPGSNHTQGIAVDVNPKGGGSSYETMWGFAKANPQFGVCFPHEGADRPHMILAGSGGRESAMCAAKGVTRPCNGLPFTPNPASDAPTSLSDAIRRAMGQQPPMPPQQPMPAQPTLPAQPTPPSQTNTATQPTNLSNPAQVNPISTLINTNTNTSSNTNTNKSTSTTATSSFDLIQQFGDPDPVSSSIDIGKAVYIDLNASTSDAIALAVQRPTSTLSATGTLAISQTLNIPQTFTSNDLANNPVSGYFSGENTFIWKILETMKNTLLLALSYLRPFGGYVPGTVAPGTSALYAD